LDRWEGKNGLGGGEAKTGRQYRREGGLIRVEQVLGWRKEKTMERGPKDGSAALGGNKGRTLRKVIIGSS